MSLAFDTHEAVKSLRGAGLDERAAESIVQVIGRNQDAQLQQLTTKADLQAVRSELKDDLGPLRSELQTFRSELKEEIALVRSSVNELRHELKADLARQHVQLIWLIVGTGAVFTFGQVLLRSLGLQT